MRDGSVGRLGRWNRYVDGIVVTRIVQMFVLRGGSVARTIPIGNVGWVICSKRLGWNGRGGQTGGAGGVHLPFKRERQSVFHKGPTSTSKFIARTVPPFPDSDFTSQVSMALHDGNAAILFAIIIIYGGT
jgi:cyclophilin family peptidyl-prolyl cis-trans isomerase